MAVNINSVYTTVLYILNKEQRGYITPTQFNSLASQVQLEIFQSYFPDGNQVNRLNQNNTQNDTEFFNIFKDISYKLFPFEQDISFFYDAGLSTSVDAFVPSTSSNLYKIGEVIANYTNTGKTNKSIAQLTSKSDYNKITRSKLTSPTEQYPLFYTTNADVTPVEATLTVVVQTPGTAVANVTIDTGNIFVGQTVVGTNVVANTVVSNYNEFTGDLTFNQNQPLAIGPALSLTGQAYNSLVLKIDPLPTSLTVNGLTTPSDPLWAFTVGDVGQYLFNSANSVNFELDISERSNLIIRILKYCGVIINDPTIIQVADEETQQVETNEKS